MIQFLKDLPPALFFILAGVAFIGAINSGDATVDVALIVVAGVLIGAGIASKD